MAIDGFGAPLSALRTNQFRLDVGANNVANVNTDGFKASTVQTSDAAYINDIGQGTRVAGAYAPSTPGPAVPSASATGGMVEASNTDPMTEIFNRMNAQNAYGTNAAMLRTADEAAQTLLDLKG